LIDDFRSFFKFLLNLIIKAYLGDKNSDKIHKNNNLNQYVMRKFIRGKSVVDCVEILVKMKK